MNSQTYVLYFKTFKIKTPLTLQQCLVKLDSMQMVIETWPSEEDL